MAEKALVDDTDSGSAFTAGIVDIFYPVISRRAVYLYVVLVFNRS